MKQKFIPWLANRKLNLVQIQTTSICNARCEVCPYGDSWYLRNPGYMSDKLYSKILDDIDEYDPEFSGKFCTYLCNEPFADKNIIDRTALAYKKLHSPYIELSSNMALLSHNTVDKLYEMYKENDFYGKFTISHHGTGRKSVEKIMKIPYKKTLDNIVYLLKKFDGQLKISIQDISYSIDRKYQMNPHRKVQRYLNRLIHDNDINTDNLITEPKVFHNRAGGVKIDGWDYKKIVRKIDNNNPFDCVRIHGCLHVIYTGEVIGCCMDYSRETIIGDLNKQSVSNFFKSKDYNTWCNMVTGKVESPEDFICKRCLSPGG